jgi:cephalosporin hydroxylase
MPLLNYDVAKALRIARTVAADGWGNLSLARRVIRDRGAIQKTWELTSALGLVKKLKPRVLMEIGTAWGGTLSAWSQVAAEDALIVSVDLPYKQLGGRTPDQHVALLQTYVQPTQRFRYLLEDSHSKETLKKVANELGGKPVDFLFIDGDHSYAGVKADFEMYSTLVRPGGLIGFHDVSPPHPRQPREMVHEVWKFWREIEPKYKHWKFIDVDKRSDVNMGVGVIEKP